jgi:hypothetical protein
MSGHEMKGIKRLDDKYYRTVSVGLLFVSVQSKHRNSLFRYRSETTETSGESSHKVYHDLLVSCFNKAPNFKI